MMKKWGAIIIVVAAIAIWGISTNNSLVGSPGPKALKKLPVDTGPKKLPGSPSDGPTAFFWS